VNVQGSPRGPLGRGPQLLRPANLRPGPPTTSPRRASTLRQRSTQRQRDRPAQLTRELIGLQRRQDNLIDQLENFEATGDTDADREYRQTIQRRFAELTITRRAKQSELDQIKIDTPPSGDDADLLDQTPQLQADMTELPESLERQLYDAFHLDVRYNRARHEATIQATIREDTIMTLTEATQDCLGLLHIGCTRRRVPKF
jgi:site-specific DNA recombinase